MTRVLAVDLGKTGCRAALDAGGSYAGPGAPGLAEAGGLAAAVRCVLAVAAEGGQPEAVGIGAAGALAAPAAAAELAGRVADELGVPVAVASDALTSHLGALGGGPGVVLAIGTGAVATACGPAGLRVVDGAGSWLGDEGGGADLGLRGLRAVLRAVDGRGPQTSLVAAATARFGPVDGLARAVGGSASPAGTAAAFAPDVVAAADDPVAAALVEDAVRTLTATALAAARTLEENQPELALTGGLVHLLGDRLRTALTGHVRLREDGGTALDGARLLAEKTDTVAEPYTRRAVPRQKAGTGLDRLATERGLPGSERLEELSTDELVGALLDAEKRAQDRLAAARDPLARLVDAVAERLNRGGRLVYVGAGTPGRLAYLDAAECVPTFGVPPELVSAVIAGGPAALTQAVEGAEDSTEADLDVGPDDAVVGISASGRTPYVLAALQSAARKGALTGAVVNNPGSPIGAAAEHEVVVDTGPEVLAGSTRLTAGTTQKIALNTLSTAVMVRLGKTYRGRMVDVLVTNEKLARRAVRITAELTGAPEEDAEHALDDAQGHVKTAVVALLAGVDAAEARSRLRGSNGHVGGAL